MKKLMSDADKTKRQLIEELELLRNKAAKLEGAEGMVPGDGRKNFYETILENFKDGIWVTSPQDVIIYANNGMAGIAGITKSKIIGLNVLRDFPEKTLKKFRPFYRQRRFSS